MATYTEQTDEVAELGDDITNRLTLETLNDAAVLDDSTGEYVTALLAEIAVLDDSVPTTNAFALLEEAALLNGTATSKNNSRRDSNEVAQISGSAVSGVSVAPTLAEAAVLEDSAPLQQPYEGTAETAVLNDAATGRQVHNPRTAEVASVSGSALNVVYATTAETAEFADSTSFTHANVAITAEVAALADSASGALGAYELCAEVATLNDGLTGRKSTSVVTTEDVRVFDTLQVPKGSIGWTANMLNFATSQYVDHPLDEIIGPYGLSANGVYTAGSEVFGFELQTAQDTFGDALGKRCTYIAASCRPADEFQVDLVAEGPDGELAFYPAQVWPRGTQRYVREFNAPRGVLSQTLGVRIRGTAPDTLDLSKLELAPLLSARR